jgi:hypothetical protein
MLGRTGRGLLQMNGQPSAENTRECGADGDLPGFRNWQNDQHVAELAAVWNVNPETIPHYAPPTHAMQIFRYAQQGSVRMLWITGTNPAVSLPELSRIRSILAQERLLVVAQDLFLTETAQLADVVLPAATWGEKTGTLTNADRTVHLSEKAVEPPGEARADLDVFLDFAARMDFRDKDDGPLITWHDPESAFAAWQRCSAGRPCDYTGLSYDRLRGGSGIQWPCTEQAPDGTARLYTDGIAYAHPDTCESYGRDMVTGASVEPVEYRSLNPDGKAVIKAAEYVPPHEDTSADYPLQLITGRTVYHFHTRTKTARAPELNAAAPDVWAEISPAEASAQGSPTATWCRSRRQRDHRHRLGPGLQTATVQDRRGPCHPRRTARDRHRRPDRDGGEQHMTGIESTLRLLHDGERDLEQDLLAAAARHHTDHEFHHVALDVARWSREHATGLADAGRDHGLHLSGPRGNPSPAALAALREKASEALGRRPATGLLLLHDLRDLHLAAARNSLHWQMLAQAAQATRDERLLALVTDCHPQTLRQLRWTNTQIKILAPQVLTSV